MRAREADVVDAVWAATEPLLPPPPEHPLGCHRPRVPDRLCLWAPHGWMLGDVTRPTERSDETPPTPLSDNDAGGLT